MNTEEVNVEADGSTTFEGATDSGVGQEEAYEDATGGGGGDFADDAGEAGEEAFEEIVKKGIDPAIYLLVVVIIFLVGFVIYQRKKKEEDEDDFFSNLDGEKVRTVVAWDLEPEWTGDEINKSIKDGGLLQANYVEGR